MYAMMDQFRMENVKIHFSGTDLHVDCALIVALMLLRVGQLQTLYAQPQIKLH